MAVFLFYYEYRGRKVLKLLFDNDGSTVFGKLNGLESAVSFKADSTAL